MKTRQTDRKIYLYTVSLCTVTKIRDKTGKKNIHTNTYGKHIKHDITDLDINKTITWLG